ncbi:MAG: hypothetical protein IIX14_06105 [Clostridia bacterium]|nr:hypothetical protein [Clostridia bacterium]
MSKGTVLYIGGFELPDRNAAAHRVINNARAFKELGYNVIFAGVDKTVKVAVTETQQVFGFESYPMPYPTSSGEWARQLVDMSHYKWVCEKCADIKYIICYNLHAIPLMKVLSYAKSKDIKVIADCTEWYENKFSPNPVRLIKFIDTELAMKVFQKRCDGMIAISTYLENYYNKFIDKILVVPPLVDATEEKWSCEPEPQDKITFVYSGTPGDAKDKIGQIVECFLKLEGKENVCFRVVGITREEFFKSYSHLEPQAEKIDTFAQFFGRVSHIDSIRLLRDADYCIFMRNSTRKNNAGFPTKFVECYTSGVGIIANEISDIKKYFPEDAYSILIEENTEEQILGALKKAISKGKAPKRSTEENPFDYRKWIDEFKSFL